MRAITGFILALFAIQSHAQNYFEATIGGTGIDEFRSIALTSDGGYLAVGATTSFGAGGQDILVAKVDGCGATVWSRTYGGTSTDYASDIQATSDGFVIVGATASFGYGNEDILVMKIDNSGAVQWSRVFGGGSDESGSEVAVAPDGSIYVSGNTSSYGQGLVDQVAMRLTSSGALMWAKVVGLSNNDGGLALQLAPNGCYVVGPHYASGYYIMVSRFLSDGTRLWTKVYNASGTDAARDVIATQDGNLLITGHTTSYGGGSDNGFAMKIDTTGAVSWSKAYAGTQIEYLTGAVQLADGDYMLTGYTYSFGATLKDSWTLRVDGGGNLLWSKRLGGAGNDGPSYHFHRSVIVTPDSALLLAEHTTTFGANGDAYLTKTNLNNALQTCNTQLVSPTVVSAPFALQTKTFSQTSFSNQQTVTLTVTSISQPSSVLCSTVVADVVQPTFTIECGDSVHMEAYGGLSYVWHPGYLVSDSTISDPTATLTATQVFTVAIVNSCDTVFRTVTINVFQPQVIAGPDTSICVGDTIQLFVTQLPHTTYQWLPNISISDTSSRTPLVFPGHNTTYVVFAQTNAGCYTTDTVSIVVNPLPVVVTSGGGTICQGDSIQLSASGGNTYHWTPATGLNATYVSNPIASPSSSTTYTVLVGNIYGCHATDTVTVNVIPFNPLATPNIGICDGDTAQLWASGGTSYSWQPPIGLNDPSLPNPLASPSSTTTYTVSISTGQCSGIRAVTVDVFTNPIATAFGTTSICTGQSTQLNATGGTSFAWTPNVGLSDSSIANPMATPATTTTYTVTVGNAFGCFDYATVTITVNPNPVANATGTATICSGLSTPLHATGGSVYSWVPPTGLSHPGISNPIASPTVTTTYTVTVANSYGCYDYDSLTITVLPAPSATAGPDDTICRGESVQLTAIGGTTYSWAPTSWLSNPNVANPIAAPIVTTLYVVSVGNGSSCYGYDTVIVYVNPLPNAIAVGDTTICIGQSTQLNATGGTTYSWQPAATLSNPNIPNPLATPAITTNYIVAVTNDYDCTVHDTITVTVEQFNPQVSPNTVICEGDTVLIWASGGTAYSWHPVASVTSPTSSTTGAFPSTPTIYTVNISTAACTGTKAVLVDVSPLPSVVAGADTSIFVGDTAFLSATGAFSYTWSPGSTLNDSTSSNPLAWPVAYTCYVVWGTDKMDCKASDTVCVEVLPLGVEVMERFSYFSVFPNPTDDEIFVHFNGHANGVTISLYTVLGQQLETRTAGSVSSGHVISLNIGYLTDALYVLTVRTDEGESSVPIALVR